MSKERNAVPRLITAGGLRIINMIRFVQAVERFKVHQAYHNHQYFDYFRLITIVKTICPIFFVYV